MKARQGAPLIASRRGRSADGHDSPHQRRFGRNTNLPPLLSSSRTRASRSQYCRGAKILLQGGPRTSPRQLLPPISPEVQLNFPKLPSHSVGRLFAKLSCAANTVPGEYLRPSRFLAKCLKKIGSGRDGHILPEIIGIPWTYINMRSTDTDINTVILGRCRHDQP